MKRLKVALSLLLVFSICSLVQSQHATATKLIYEDSGEILIDGKFAGYEWNGTLVFEVSDEFSILLNQSKNFLFIGVRSSEAHPTHFTELFIMDPLTELTHNFHASFHLGERIITDPSWETLPNWHWGNNSGWTANVIKFDTMVQDGDALQANKVYPYQGQEFQFLKSKFTGKRILIRVEIRDFTNEDAKAITFPITSDRKDAYGWFELSFK